MLQAEPHVGGTFLLMNGDNVFAGSVESAIEAVEEADTALAVKEVSPEVATTTGVIETDEAGRVTGIVENRPIRRRRSSRPGAMCSRGFFHTCGLLRPSPEGEYQLSEAVGLLVRAGYEIVTVRFDGRVNVKCRTSWSGRPGWSDRGEAYLNIIFDGFLQSILEASFWFPSQRSKFGRVQRVSLIVTRAILNEFDLIFRAANHLDDLFGDIEVCQFSPASDIVHLP